MGEYQLPQEIQPPISEGPENPAENQEAEKYRPLQLGESFEGGMPILEGEEAKVYCSKVEELYGSDEAHSGKWGTVFLSGDKATKIFNQPDNILTAYEVEFMRRYGGMAGMPKFEGVVPNGYQMERLQGESLRDTVDTAFRKKGDKNPPEVWQEILSKDQVQDLLDKVAEFHRVTGRVHGDLGHWDDIIVTPEGVVRLTDPEWERIGKQTPRSELNSLYEFFTRQGYPDLIFPETIRDEESIQNLRKFKDEVKSKVEIDPVFNRVTRFRDQKVEIKVSREGETLVKGIY